jgi:hypothetical protein
MMSMTKKFGKTDLGPTGIENWLHSHRCTQFCSPSWKNWSGARCLIEPVFSTTMTLDVATAPASGQEFVRARPCEIKFTHDSISSQFQDGHSLLETAVQIGRQEVGKRDICMINVVRANGGLELFALDNRRLAVFRLLEMSGRVGTIKVEVVPYHRWKDELTSKNTTMNGGESILVRGYRKDRIGTSLADTTFLGLDQIRNARHTGQVLPDSQFYPFLANFTDE